MISSYNGIYSLSFSINGDEIPLDPSNISFSMIDGIMTLYNRGTVEIKDLQGLLGSSGLIMKGHTAELNLGIGDTILKNKYVIESPIQTTPAGSNSLSGIHSFNLTNAWKYQQNYDIQAFHARLSEVIEQLVEDGPFTDLVINDTGNFDKWFKTRTAAKFINDSTKYAFSSDAEGTPFVSFISSDGVFHFQSLHRLFGVEGNNATEYSYFPDVALEKGYFTILGLVVLSNPNTAVAQRVVDIDLHTGEVHHDDVYLKDIKASEKALPIGKIAETELPRFDLNFQNYDNDENRKGLIAHRFLESFFTEMLLLVVPFNPKLVSGCKVNVKVPLIASEPEILSDRYSGEYLILLSEHIWLGEERQAYSKFLVGRKGLKLTEEVTNKLDLVKE